MREAYLLLNIISFSDIRDTIYPTSSININIIYFLLMEEN